MTYGWRDIRTGQRIGMATVATRAQAERYLAKWWERDERGGRPDIHDILPYVEVYEIEDES